MAELVEGVGTENPGQELDDLRCLLERGSGGGDLRGKSPVVGGQIGAEGGVSAEDVVVTDRDER